MFNGRSLQAIGPWLLIVHHEQPKIFSTTLQKKYISAIYTFEEKNWVSSSFLILTSRWLSFICKRKLKHARACIEFGCCIFFFPDHCTEVNNSRNAPYSLFLLSVLCMLKVLLFTNGTKQLPKLFYRQRLQVVQTKEMAAFNHPCKKLPLPRYQPRVHVYGKQTADLVGPEM